VDEGWRELIQRVRIASIGRDLSGAKRAEIVTAEALLGIELPVSYKRFATELGRVFWPVEIFAPKDLRRSDGRFGQPSFLVAFATDGGGNDWCFDTRRLFDGEYSIVFWDHEEPTSEVEEPASAIGGFAEWLETLVHERSAEDEAAARKEQRDRLDDLLRPRFGGVFPYTPSEDEVRGAEASLGVTLPQDYRWFTQSYGGIQWPLAISDALDVAELRSRMRDQIPGAQLLPIATDGHGVFYGFLKGSDEVHCLSAKGLEPTRKTFLEWIEEQIADRAHKDRVAALERAATGAKVVTRRKK
jgi:hypothetical protein